MTNSESNIREFLGEVSYFVPDADSAMVVYADGLGFLNVQLDDIENLLSKKESVSRQLEASRYQVIQIRFTEAVKMVMSGEMPEKRINKFMAEAMANYDQIIASAGEGKYGDLLTDENQGKRDFLQEYRDLRAKRG